MPSIELSKLQAVTSPRALSETDRTPIDPRTPLSTPSSVSTGANIGTSNAGISLEIGASVDPAQPPVNQDRVAQIRDALRDGAYPLVPAKIADAMIAAQLNIRNPQ